MVAALLLAVGSLGPTPTPMLDGDQFMEIMRGLHSGIRDFQLVCEGEVRWMRPAIELQAKNSQFRFQGSYAYRAADGAAYLDLYTKPFEIDSSFLRKTQSVLKGRRFDLIRSSEQKRGFGLPTQENLGGPRCFTDGGSPERFLYLNLWRQLDYSPRDKGYTFEGWDEIDGHAVVRIAIDEYPKSDSAKRYVSHYWIDLERGGHVVRVERYGGTDLWFRMHNVRLRLVPAGNGKEVWFPVHAELDTFLFGFEFQKTPVYHETYDIVTGTLVLNQGLGDERFSVDWKGPVARSKTFDQAADGFRSTPAPTRLPASPRTDPAGVMEDQRRRLEEADRQAAQLDASPRANPGWPSGTLLQAGLSVIGFGSLVLGWVLRRRVL